MPRFNFKTATRQQCFDKAVTAILAQGRASFSIDREDPDDRGSCMYRGPDGLKCAIGHLLPDGAVAGHEQRTASFLPAFGGRSMDDLEFFDKLQAVHDDAASGCDTDHEFVEYFKGAAFKVARLYNLDPGVLL